MLLDSENTSLEYKRELDSPEIIRSLQLKLPTYLQDKWNRKAFELRAKSQIVRYDDFFAFVNKECSLANDPMYSKEAFKEMHHSSSQYSSSSYSSYKFGKPVKNLAIDLNNHQCPLCCGNHDLDKCKNYLASRTNK